MSTITLIRVDLELTSPGGVSGPESGAGRDGAKLPLACDPDGNPYVPATSLAGSLRAHAGDEAARLFGQVGGNAGSSENGRDDDVQGAGQVGGRGRSQTGGKARTGSRANDTAAGTDGRDGANEVAVASPVRFVGTAVELAAPLVARSRTAVDRRRAAAASGMLRTSQHLPPGSTITAYLRLDDPSLLDELLSALAGWRPYVGGGRSVGFGQAKVTGVRSRTLDLASPSGLRSWLTEGGPDLYGDAVTEPVTLPEAEAEGGEGVLRSEWEIVDGLHIGSGRRDEEDKVAQSLRASDGTPFVPGSTWKGVLRSRCEFILRSIGVQACESDGCLICLICQTFGWSGGDGDSVGLRSRLIFVDSPIREASQVVRQHVALDRFTGGAADGLLFAEEVVESGRLTLEVQVDGNPVSAVVPALLTLAMADIHDGFVGVGSATTRGLGTLRRTDLDDDRAKADRAAAIGVLTDYWLEESK